MHRIIYKYKSIDSTKNECKKQLFQCKFVRVLKYKRLVLSMANINRVQSGSKTTRSHCDQNQVYNKKKGHSEETSGTMK